MYVVAGRRFDKPRRFLMPKFSTSALFLALNSFLPLPASCLKHFGCKRQPSERGQASLVPGVSRVQFMRVSLHYQKHDVAHQRTACTCLAYRDHMHASSAACMACGCAYLPITPLQPWQTQAGHQSML